MLLSVENLSVEYPQFHFHPVSFQLDAGEILAVIGESGSGKTTLARAVSCLLPKEAHVSGRVLLEGEELLTMPDSRRRQLRMSRLAIAFQSSAQYLNPTMDLAGHLREILDRRIPRREQQEYMASLMEEVGLSPEDLSRYPSELSGGMAQKFLLACAVALRPALVILDEPTSSLDQQSAREFVTLIRELNRQHRIAFLVITHDMRLAADLSSRMMVLYEGHLMEMGDTQQVLDRPRHPYTRGLLHASVSLNLARDIWGIPPARDYGTNCCPFYGRCTQSVDICGQCPPDLRRIDDRWIACHRGGIVKLLEGQQIGKSFGSQQVLKGCSLSVYSGEIVSLVGKCGVGKTTLARILSGFDDGKYEGQVLFEEKKADFGQLHRMIGGVQMVFQDSEGALNPRLTVAQAVEEPLLLNKMAQPERWERVVKALEEVGLPTVQRFLDQPIRTLSGGQKQRVCLARAMTMEPKLLIADEPTAMLDPSSCANVLRMLKALQNRRGFSMLVITHDLDSAVKISDSIYLLSGDGLSRVRPSEYIKNDLSKVLE